MTSCLSTPLISLDFETTGLAPEAGDRITEVGLVRIEGGRIVDRFSSLMNCGAPVPRSITVYTGITQRMLDAAPPPLAVIPKVLAFIDGCSVISHNAMFDQQFLQAECLRLGLPVAIEPFICSMRIARRLYPEVRSPSLAELARVLKLPVGSAPHRAAADAQMTAQLALRLMRDLDRWPAGEGEPPPLLRRLRDWSGIEPALAV